MPCSAALKIAANSTRRVKWHTKLGFCRDFSSFSISLNAISEHGGQIARTKAFILRIYPMIQILKETNGDEQKTSKFGACTRLKAEDNIFWFFFQYIQPIDRIEWGNGMADEMIRKD